MEVTEEVAGMVVVMASTVDVSITVDFIVVSEAAMVEEVAMDMDNGLAIESMIHKQQKLSKYSNFI